VNLVFDVSNGGEIVPLEAIQLNIFEPESSELLWEELRVGEYRVWLRGGLHYEMNWQYGFQHQPEDRTHGPLTGPVFEDSPPDLPNDFDAAKTLAIQMVLLDGQDPNLGEHTHRF
jgi:hypothetical protein